MSDLVRFSLSLEKALLDKLEMLLKRGGYANRSEFVRDMIRNRIVEREWKEGSEVVGAITLVYDHHKRDLNDRLVTLQHRHHKTILATTHVHLDEDLCAETILARGPAPEITRLADELRRQKGVLHGALSLSSTGRALV
jgi:CopG family transcriptional regulator, nickel-responsive regulator